ncbi:MAG: hypothetical protein LCI03_20785, partial [Actinobacteria bacterium]|nr:hypothetical protein [Actinomycetota bacterium]
AAATLLAALSTLLVTGGTAAWSLGAHEVPPAAARTTLAAPASAAPASQRCGSEPQDARGWSHVFESAHHQWSGGDGASSTRLPDGRLLWLFGDSFSGALREDGSRGPGTATARNAVVVTEGGCLESLTPGRDALPSPPGSWLWPTHAVVVGSGTSAQVVVFAQRLATDASDPVGFTRTGAVTLRLEVPTGGAPRVTGQTDLPQSATLWGAATAADGDVTWVYGTRQAATGAGRDLLLARAPTGTVGDPTTWRYRTASGWSSEEADAAVVLAGSVSTVPSARARGGRVLLVTKPGEFLDPRVVALSAAHPWGPWRRRVLLRDPSTPARLAYSPALVDVLPGRPDVVLVNHTSTDLAALMVQGHLADPRFHDVGHLGVARAS